MRHLIVGAGEVGIAVHAVLSCAHDALIRDLDPVDLDPVDVLHVCFPWSHDFDAHVEKYAAEHRADLVVVHSTVPPGTCDPHGWVHSPVRGRHPRLTESIFAFIKHFGGAQAEAAAADFEAAGVNIEVHGLAADTEAGKVWELIQYGLQIHAQKAIHAWCDQHGLDFDVVYTAMAHTYNDGYADLGHHEFLRPVLTHMPGPVGGHCVTQNAALIDHPLARLVADT